MSSAAQNWRPGARRAPETAAVPRGSEGRNGRWILAFLVFQIANSLALLSTTLASARIVFRSSAFLSSVVLVLLVGHGSKHRHVAHLYALLGIGFVVLSFFNPSTDNMVGGLAHVLLYVAILGPIFWVPHFRVTPVMLRQALLIMWVFHTASAFVGTMQVYDPTGPLSPEVVITLRNANLENLHIVLANGQSVFRPSGLSDVPGGAAASGFYSVLLGLGFLLERPKWYFRALLFGGIFVGLFVLFICQVRSLMVMLAICISSMMVVLAPKRIKPVLTEGAIFIALAIVTFTLAADVGGESMTKRIGTLFEDDASTVYYNNRGHFLEHTVLVLLPEYPLGAGLGRWGMLYYYFASLGSQSIHVEIQWTAWLLDGGLPLVIVSATGLITTAAFAWRVARGQVGPGDDSLLLWGAVIFGYDLGAIALTFNYSLFIGQLGLEFWLLNAALFTAVVRNTVSPKTMPTLEKALKRA